MNQIQFQRNSLKSYKLQIYLRDYIEIYGRDAILYKIVFNKAEKEYKINAILENDIIVLTRYTDDNIEHIFEYTYTSAFHLYIDVYLKEDVLKNCKFIEEQTLFEDGRENK